MLALAGIEPGQTEKNIKCGLFIRNVGEIDEFAYWSLFKAVMNSTNEMNNYLYSTHWKSCFLLQNTIQVFENVVNSGVEAEFHNMVSRLF